MGRTLCGLVSVLAVAMAPSPQAPALTDVLARAAAYHADYTQKVSGVSLGQKR